MFAARPRVCPGVEPDTVKVCGERWSRVRDARCDVSERFQQCLCVP